MVPRSGPHILQLFVVFLVLLPPEDAISHIFINIECSQPMSQPNQVNLNQTTLFCNQFEYSNLARLFQHVPEYSSYLPSHVTLQHGQDILNGAGILQMKHRLQ